ncbi:Glycoside hydrolase, family 31 [Cordyceps fumosorosea ARSEF 2679]|uniref:Glycoside hydrolase, family 31 n=1 Tax=Cordyceps fumosorosea (strain ARSEF 2679) TaxID=1081104 RepID=A0A167KS27_CORFA|nr:Glycoside hydrolase, family 31 [Cordyceps fumosorosea ARSEF 2679]OAA52113.1 Glycoside hydrolase, family 31 [Cordyceps fumosorosea ARSEF 2679]
MALHTPTTTPSVFVGGRKGDKFRFTVLADGLVRYEWAPDGSFEDRPSAFAANRRQCQSDALPSHRLVESARCIDIHTSRFHLTYRKAAAGFSPETLSARIHGPLGSTWRYGDAPATLGGTCRTLDGVDGRTHLEPGVTSRTGFANLDDASMLFTADGFIAPRKEGKDRVDAYLFCYGHDYRDAVKALYRVSGAPPLLPRWALGNWWSRYYEYTADSYLALMDRFAAARVPLAVAVVDMDWHWVRDPRVVEAGASGWSGYSWDTNLFPEPREFVAELHRRGLKITLNEHPADGVARYEDVYKEMARALGHDTSHGDAIPFDITDRAFVKAYYGIALRHVEEDGVDFWWTDWQQGTHSGMPGVDPLWPLNHFHFLHNADLQRRRGTRPLVFSRYAGAGSHRYPIGFSGDTVTSWASLAFQPEFTATASNVGYGWWSHDIGGHMLGARDDHLTARWAQLGVLSPVMRLHSTKTRWVAKEPWNLPLGGPQETVVEFLRLRHRLLPYLHTMNKRAAESGEPLVQPMYWEHPEREEAYGVPNEYCFGTQLLAAPITAPQNRAIKTGKVRAWLPPGTWVDFFTGVVYDGDREMWLSRTLDKTPLLMRQGAIVPLDADEDGGANGAANPQGLEIVVAVGADGRFDIMEEDESFEGYAEEPRWVTTSVALDQRTGVLTIGPNRSGALAYSRRWKVRLLGVRDPTGITASVGGLTTASVATAVENGTMVDLGRIAPGDTAVLFLGPNPQLSVNDFKSLIFPILYDAQVSFELKEKIDEIITPKDVPASIRVGQLAALDMDEDLRHVLNEFLLADSRS